MDMPNLSAGLLGPAPLSQGQTAGGMSSNWGGGASSSFSNKNQFHSPMHPKMRSRVVVAKYDRKPNNNKALFAFTEPFGTLREHLVLKTKAFLEMDTHQEAVDMVNYYQQNPARMFGKNVIFYLSKELLVIEKEDRPGERANREVKGQGSQVVFFSNLPREQDEQMELLTVAGRFGLVEKHLFLTSKAFVQLGTPEDAEMMVKYYNQNPLIIKGRTIRLNICTKYKTLNVSRRGGYGAPTGDNRGRWSSEPTPANKNYPNRAVDKSSVSKSSSSKSTASSKEKKKPEEKQVAEGESDEEEEEVAGVMEGDDEAEEGKEECEVEQEPDVEEPQPGTVAPDEDEEGSEKPPADSSHTAEAPQEPGGITTGDDSTTEDKDANGAKDEDNQLAETKKPSEPTESSTEEPETREETATDPAESAGMTERELPEDLEGTVDQDFMENMDDFVTLDELAEDEDDLHTKDSDSFDSTKEGGMRVVNILGFRRGYNFLEELLALAKPFGKVVKHLVLDLKSEAYLQFATEDEAKAMSRFYNRNITASVCGKPVKICHSQTYPTIQCGDSKVVYIGQLPHSKYTDESVLKLAEPFGQVKKYFVNRIRKECFIEMENAEDAEKIAEAYKVNPPKLQGKRQTVYVSRKYKQLKYGHRRIQLEERKASKRDASSSSSSQDKSSKHSEETPAKRSKEETTPAEEEEAVEREQEEESAEVSSGEQEAAAEPMETQSEHPEPGESDQPGQQDPAVDVKREEVEDVSADQNQNRPAEEPTPAETKPAAASLPPYEQNNPVGVEYVRTGFYCRVCFLFYSNEETAKKVHCSSQAHYDKVKKHLEKEQAKAQNKKEKKNLE